MWLVTLLLVLTVEAATVKDMVGRDVLVASSAPRVVSLVPSITETLYTIGAEDQLVGVTTSCDFPAAAAAKPKVGGLVNPSLEAIARLQPDLVLATTEGNRETTIQQLDALGIPTYVVRPNTFDGVLESIARLGRLTGHEPRAKTLVAELRRRAARVTEAVKGRTRPRVLYLVWPDPLVVPGRDTLLTELIQMAGGESVSAGESIKWPRLSLEHAVMTAPEVIVSGSHNRAHVQDALRRWRSQNI
ncbi:MAG: ABC transporter substrate-binding protein, partial [Candidatus Rokubacteria bacterium]|nr:ABC transporter substrate-binding protein [Candidatus Rokubacteria bacterium]